MNGAERRTVAAVVAEAVKDALSLYRAEREGGADDAKAREVVMEEVMPEALDELNALFDDDTEGSSRAGREDGEDAAPGLDDLVALAASRRSGLRARYAGTPVAMTRRAVEWAHREANSLSGCSVLPMLAFHLRRRAERTEFRVCSPYPSAGSEGTVVMEWVDDGPGGELSLKMSFEDGREGDRESIRPGGGGA